MMYYSILLLGIISTTAGIGGYNSDNGSPNGVGYNGDNILATSTWLNEPRALIFDAFDNLYFIDTCNYRMRVIMKSTGIITTIFAFPSISTT